MIFNVNVFYQKCLKLIEQAYKRLKRIQSLPKKAFVRRQQRFYDAQGQLLKARDLKILRRQLDEKIRLTNLNKQLKSNLQKYVQVLQIFDKSLSFFLKRELTAYCLDEIPLDSRESLLKDVLTQTYLVKLKSAMDEWHRWARGEIQAREIAFNLIQKMAN